MSAGRAGLGRHYCYTESDAARDIDSRSVYQASFASREQVGTMGPQIAHRTATGISGLDGVLHGGLPKGKNALIVGTPGSGKTMLALQFLVEGILRFDEPGMFVSFEEAPEMLRAVAVGLGLAPDGPHAERLHILDGRPIIDALDGGAFDIGGLAAIVGNDVRRLDVRRIAFDGLDALFALSANGAVTGREFRRLVELTDGAGLTSLICLKPGFGNDDLPNKFDAIEYAADAVIRLGYRVNFGLVQRIMRIVKIRNAGFAAGEHPFVITARGMSISFYPALKAAPMLSLERVSIGVPQLDQMLEGGFLRSSTTLISGLPGTAKSTIGASFLEAGLKRGERCMLVALDEPAQQLIANVRSVGINMDAYLASGQLQTLSLNAGSVIADEHFLMIERAIEIHRPTIIVIDPISAFEKAGGASVAQLVVDRLTWLVKERGIAAVFTAVASSNLNEVESTASQVSAIADTWIHLSFAVRGGERNRTLTIVKSRGTAHSNQLREMILSASGIALQDVYQIQGDFLLGTARLEREQEQKRETQARQLNAKTLLRELDDRKMDALAKLRDAERELLDVNERMAEGIVETASIDATAIHDRFEVDASRGDLNV
jgi:circadian clock protein KaiC